MLQYFEIQGSQCFKATTPVSNVMSVCHKPVYHIKYNGTVKNLHGLPAVYMLKFSNIVSSFMMLSPNLNPEYVCLNLVKYSCLAHYRVQFGSWHKVGCNDAIHECNFQILQEPHSDLS